MPYRKFLHTFTIFRHYFAGVGLNLATAFSHLGVDTKFLSVVGQDPSGDFILSQAEKLSKDLILRVPGVPTASYCSVLDTAGEVIVNAFIQPILEFHSKWCKCREDIIFFNLWLQSL